MEAKSVNQIIGYGSQPVLGTASPTSTAEVFVAHRFADAVEAGE